MKVRLKINGIIIFFAFLAVVIFPAVFFRNAKEGIFDNLAEILGLSSILLGQIIRISARGYKSENSLQGNILIQGGPYALVRNPMYLGILFAGLGVVLALFQWWVLFIFLFVFILRYLSLIFKEEGKLKNLFPEEYPIYQKNVPRLLPSISELFKKDIVKYLPLKLSWIKKEIGSVSAVLFVTIFLESREEIKNGSLGGYLKDLTPLVITIILFAGLAVYLTKRTEASEKNV